jgi:alpha-methylacyl-CoA racemase
VCLARHPALVYGRMTGWGQTGPLAQRAGHDIDYIALTGVLEAIGRAGERPVPPLNLVGDFGGGGMMLAFGVVSALLAVRSGAAGQVIDAAIVDGATTLGTGIHGLRNTGLWPNPRGQNLLDGGAPFYDTYECADGRFLAIGALEPGFYAELVARAGLDDSYDRADLTTWPAQRAAWAAVFRTRTRDAWAALLADSDACAAPVLDWDEAPDHPHMAARGVFVEHAGRRQPGPAPRLSGTPAELRLPPPHPGEHTDSILESIGRDPVALRAAGVVA